MKKNELKLTKLLIREICIMSFLIIVSASQSYLDATPLEWERALFISPLFTNQMIVNGILIMILFLREILFIFFAKIM